MLRSNPDRSKNREFPTPGAAMPRATVDIWQYCDRGESLAKSLRGTTSDSIDLERALEECCKLIPGYVFFYHQLSWKKDSPTSILNLLTETTQVNDARACFCQ